MEITLSDKRNNDHTFSHPKLATQFRLAICFKCLNTLVDAGKTNLKNVQEKKENLFVSKTLCTGNCISTGRWELNNHNQCTIHLYVP
jgi:hypothetical protein